MISPQATNIYFISWWPIESIYVHSENIDIRNDGTDLVYIEYYTGYKSDLYWWRKMVWNFFNHSTDVQSTASTEILQTFPMTNLINICSFWEISIFGMTALISCTSNTMLDINRPYIGGERRFGISVATALVMQQSTASTENLHTFLADDQFDLYMFVLRISIF